MVSFYRSVGMVLAGIFFMAVLVVSSCVYAWQDDVYYEPIGGLASAESPAVESLAAFDMPPVSVSYELPAPLLDRVDTYGVSPFSGYQETPSLSLSPMPPGPVSPTPFNEPLFDKNDLTLTLGSGYTPPQPIFSAEGVSPTMDIPAMSLSPALPLSFPQGPSVDYSAPQVTLEPSAPASINDLQEQTWNFIPAAESLIEAPLSGPAPDTNFNTMALTPVLTDATPPTGKDSSPAVEIEIDEGDVPAAAETQANKPESGGYKVVPAVNEMKGSDGKMYHVFEDKDGFIRIAQQLLDITDKKGNVLASVPTKIVNGEMAPATDAVAGNNGGAYWVTQDKKTGEINIAEQSIDFKNQKTQEVIATVHSTGPGEWLDEAVGGKNDNLYQVIKDEQGNPATIKLEAGQMVDPILFTDKKSNQPRALVPAYSTEDGGVTPAVNEVKGMDGKEYHVYTDKDGNVRIASKTLDFLNQRTGQVIVSIPVTIENNQEKFPDQVKGANNRLYQVIKDNSGYPTSIEPVIGQQWDTITFTNKNGQPLLNIPTRLEKTK